MNYSSFFDRFIPDNLKADPAIYSRAKNIVGCSLVLLPSGFAFALLFVIVKLYSGVALTLAATIAYLSIPFIVKSGKSLNIAGGLAALALWVLLFGLILLQGGLLAANITWLPLIAVMASFLNGTKSGIRWLIFTFISVLFIQVLHQAGFKFPDPGFTPEHAILLLGLGIGGAVLFIGLITIVSESMKKKAFEGMFKSQAENAAALKKAEEMARRLEEDKLKLHESEERLSEQKKYLSDSIDMILKEMNRFSKGDLTVSLKHERDDEIGKLFDGFNMAVEHIRELVTNIEQAVQAAASTSNEISSSSEEMAAGAQEQNVQASEAVNAVEEMTRIILESSKYASQAAGSSRLASERAQNGAGQVERTKQGMENIASSAKDTGRIISSLAHKTDQIGEIAQVIDDIADQTNLLALNAAIEAARAGEQGRGFAVVADEVRKLAERTTKATKEIAETIKAIQNEAREADSSMDKAEKAVEEGLKLTDEVAGALSQILAVNEKVLGLVTQVEDGSKRQSNAAEMINKNIEGIANVTQQSAAGTAQIAHAAEDLSRLTMKLQDLTSRFRLEASGVTAEGFLSRKK